MLSFSLFLSVLGIIWAVMVAILQPGVCANAVHPIITLCVKCVHDLCAHLCNVCRRFWYSLHRHTSHTYSKLHWPLKTYKRDNFNIFTASFRICTFAHCTMHDCTCTKCTFSLACWRRRRRWIGIKLCMKSLQVLSFHIPFKYEWNSKWKQKRNRKKNDKCHDNRNQSEKNAFGHPNGFVV